MNNEQLIAHLHTKAKRSWDSGLPQPHTHNAIITLAKVIEAGKLWPCNKSSLAFTHGIPAVERFMPYDQPIVVDTWETPVAKDIAKAYDQHHLRAWLFNQKLFMEYLDASQSAWINVLYRRAIELETGNKVLYRSHTIGVIHANPRDTYWVWDTQIDDVGDKQGLILFQPNQMTAQSLWETVNRYHRVTTKPMTMDLFSLTPDIEYIN